MEKVVFEYSHSKKEFDENNIKHRKLVEYIYDVGIDKCLIHAMNCDNNLIIDKVSREFTWLFYFIEKNKGLFYKYCDYLVNKKEIVVSINEDKKIEKDSKLLKDYYLKETYVLVVLKLLKLTFDYNYIEKQFFHDYNYTRVKAVLYNKKENFLFYISNEYLNSLGQDFKEKLSLGGEMLDAVDLPVFDIFEKCLPAFCRDFSYYDFYERKDVDELLNILNYSLCLH